MAILNSLLNSGNARILGKLYATDLEVSGNTYFPNLSAVNGTFSGTLGVTGNTTLTTLTATGTATFSKTTDAATSSNAGPALIVGGTATSAHLEFDSNEIIAKSSGTQATTLFLNAEGGAVHLSNQNKIYANNGTFNTVDLVASGTSSLNNATATKIIADNVHVLDLLRATRYEIDSISAVGGSLYVAPTIIFSSNAQVAITAISGTTVTAAFIDSTSISSDTIGGVQWTNYSKIKISGRLGDVILGNNGNSCPGTLTAKMNTTAGRINCTFTCDSASQLSIKTYTASEVHDLRVMIYEKGVNSTTSYPVGILLTGYGTNNRSYIDMYQGEDSRTKPRVRLGMLDDLDASINVGGIQPTGWGLYADNVFLKGTIHSTAGIIGEWTMADGKMYYTANTPGANSMILSPGGVSSSTSIGGSSGTNTWAFTIKNVYGVTTDGALYSTSGKIGGWTIGTTSLTNGTWGTDGSAMMSTGTTSGKAIGGSKSALSGWTFSSGANFGVTKTGALYCSDAHVEGEITATSGTIGGCSIVDGQLQVPSKLIVGSNSMSINLMKNTYAPDVSSASKYPMLIDQTANTQIYPTTASGISTEPHGVRVTLSSGVVPYFRFGNTTANTEDTISLMGLTPGKKYTMSFTLNVKLFSNDTSTATERSLYGYIYYRTTPSGGYASTSSTIYTFSQQDKGVSLTINQAYFTFTVPNNAVHVYLMIRPVNTSSLYKSGDYIGLDNIMLEEGEIYHDYIPSIYDISVTNIYTANTTTIDGGRITAGSITANKISTFGGWTIDDTKMYYPSTTTTPGSTSMILSPNGISSTTAIGGSSGTNTWAFTVKNVFGVTTAGALYSTSGKIGGWTIGTSDLHNGTTSMTNTTAGIYLGTSGIRNYKDSNTYVNIQDGKISAKGVDLTGSITATSGTIGGCSITNGVLQVASANISSIDASKITTGTFSADRIDVSGITIGQNQVTNLSTDLGKLSAQYGTSSTTASTQTKAVTCSGFELYAGAMITVKFTYANTYYSNPVKLNVNSKGAKDIWVGNAVTGSTNQLLWAADASITFRYDGTQFIVIGEPRTWYGTCSTDAGTNAKVVPTDTSTDTTSCIGCVICKGAVVSLSMTNNNTATSPALNIRSTGAKALYAGSGTTRPLESNGLSWTAGSTTNFIFDGQYWRVGDSASLARAYSAQSSASSASTAASNAQTAASNAATAASNAQTAASNAATAASNAQSTADTAQTTATNAATAASNAQTAATNAAKTATNYITTVTNAGIKVHDANNTTDYLQIKSDGSYIYKGGALISSFGNDITLGQTSSTNRNIFIDSDSGVSIRKGTTTLANYGDTITLYHGTSGKQALTIDSTNGLKFYKTDGSTVSAQLNSNGLILNNGFIGGTSGWNITSNKLYNGTIGADNSMFLGTADLGSASIAGYSRNDWRMTVGGNFGVTNTGTMYCNDAVISGAVNATSGNIGGCEIVDGTLTVSKLNIREGTQRNLMLNTLNPSLDSGSKIKVIGNPEIYIEDASYGLWSTTSHGIRFTYTQDTSFNIPLLRIFMQNISSSDYINNGQYYTFSMDVSYKMFSKMTSSQTSIPDISLELRSGTEVIPGQKGGTIIRLSKDIKKGAYVHKIVFFTFFIPLDKDGVSIFFSRTASGGSTFPKNGAGDYFSINYFMLEEGQYPSEYKCAPEDELTNDFYIGDPQYTKYLMAYCKNSFTPVITNVASLGDSSHLWTTVYATNQTINTSDERKKDFTYIYNKYSNLFMSIKPIEFTWKNDTDKRVHFGIGAQTLEESMKELGYDNMYMIQYDEESDSYSAVYTELQMLTIPVVQDHEYRIRQLEKENKYLREKIELLIKEGA